MLPEYGARMRGFLQRFAASAARLEPSVHPIVGAMFESSLPVQGTPWEESVEAPSLIERARGVESVQRSTTTIALPEPLTTEHARSFLSERTFEKSPGVVEPHKLVQVEGQQVAREKESKESRCEDVSAPQIVPATSMSREESAREAVKTRTPAGGRPVVLDHPLVGAMRRQDTIANEDGVPREPRQARRSPVSTRAERQRGIERSASLQAEKQTTEDIQIHIGRIEVIAERQAAAPPPPKPIRRSLNLQEYLKRRDGRRS
jgi:hypothetical protein